MRRALSIGLGPGELVAAEGEEGVEDGDAAEFGGEGDDLLPDPSGAFGGEPGEAVEEDLAFGFGDGDVVGHWVNSFARRAGLLS